MSKYWYLAALFILSSVGATTAVSQAGARVDDPASALGGPAGDIATPAAVPETAQFRLGVAWSSSLFSNKERFEFTVGGGEKIVLTQANPTVYFSRTFNAGEAYSISQVSGPRTCNLAPQRGTFADQDLLVTATCGLPSLTLFKLAVTGVESSEIFKFADGYGRRMQVPFSTTANLGGFPVGDDYNIVQTSGPRQCRMTNERGTVPPAPLTIRADCARTPVSTTPPPVKFEHVSRSSDDTKFGTFYDSSAPVIGGQGADEGRYVAFVSYAQGLGGSSGKRRQIIWRDRKTGETIAISSGAGGEGNGDSFAPAITPDGMSVAFESHATNLVPIDTNGVRDVFVWSYLKKTVTAVSEAPGGVEANGEAFEPAISADGNLIAFTSSASTLTPGVEGTSTVNVFLRDMRSGMVKLISADTKTKKGVGGSRPTISEDGSRIAFYSISDKLVEGDKNGLWDVFVWDRSNPRLKRISLTSAGAERNQGDESASRVVNPAISGDGRFATFSTTSTNVVGSDPDVFQDVYVVEIDSGNVILASSSLESISGDGHSPIAQGDRAPISRDGKWVVFTTAAKNLGGNLILKNLETGETVKVGTSGDTSVGTPSISSTSKCLAFPTSARLDPRFPSSGIFVMCR